MKLSQYVQVIPTQGSFILFNTINSNIVELEPRYFQDGVLQIEQFSTNEIEYLQAHDFFIDTEHALEKFIDEDTKPDWLDIIISVTENCNLHCKYCYENNFFSTSVITYETIDKILIYINQILEQHPTIHAIKFDLIGGEPTLALPQIKYLIQRVNEQIDIEVVYCLETNGTLFTKDMQSVFENTTVTVHVPLSLPEDHDVMRVYHDGTGSFNIVLHNLQEAQSFFEDNRHTLSVRYNAHMNNVKKYQEFVAYIQKALPFDFEIDYALVINYDYNDFMNTLSREEHKQWNMKAHFRYSQSPYSEENFLLLPTKYMQCQGYSPYSIKFFSDGTLGLCNAWMYGDRRGHVDDLISGKDKLTIFPEIQKPIPIDQECIECKNLFLCGGKRLCRGDNQCDFIDFPIDDYLKQYVEGRE